MSACESEMRLPCESASGCIHPRRQTRRQDRSDPRLVERFIHDQAKSNFRRACPTNRQAPVLFADKYRTRIADAEAVSVSFSSLTHTKQSLPRFLPWWVGLPGWQLRKETFAWGCFQDFFSGSLHTKQFHPWWVGLPGWQFGITTFAWGCFSNFFSDSLRDALQPRLLVFCFCRERPDRAGSGTHKIPTKSGIGRRPCRAAEVRSNSTIV